MSRMTRPASMVQAACLSALLGLLPPATAFSQTAPNKDSTDSGKKDSAESADAVVLNPFVVSTERDVGFVAASALTGGRLATDLNDTPVSYSVLTREFIDALNLTNYIDAARWTLNANIAMDDGRNVMYGSDTTGYVTFRGVAMNAPQVGFFPVNYVYDSYNLDRFDFARGANSILFGAGDFGGTPVAMLKQAKLNNASNELKTTFSSWGSKRGTLDMNRALTRNLAVRFNLLGQDSHTWRDREFTKKVAYSGFVTYQPWRNTEVIGSADFGRFDQNVAVTTLVDRFSGWDGKTVFNTTTDKSPIKSSTWDSLGVGRESGSWDFIPGLLPDKGLVYMGNTGITLAGNDNSRVPVAGKLVVGPSVNFAGNPFIERLNAPADIFNNALSGSQFFYPRRSFTVAGNDRGSRQYYKNFNLSINQRIGNHIMLNATGNYVDSKRITDFTAVRGMNTVYIDINQFLTTGAPNPNFLQPYGEGQRWKSVNERIDRQFRTGAAWFDNNRFGYFQVNAEYGENRSEAPSLFYKYGILDHTTDPRTWLVGPSNPPAIFYRYYLNNYDRPEPDLGTTTGYGQTGPGSSRTLETGWLLDNSGSGGAQRSYTTYKHGQLALFAKLFKNRLSILGAVRRDDYRAHADQELNLKDISDPNWNGSANPGYKPRPPADYYKLTYLLKNPDGSLISSAPQQATSRPRDAYRVPLPQYANDRFQDDYSSPEVGGALNTKSIGGVLHVTKWLSVLGNRAETFSPPSTTVRINNQPFDPLLSKGWNAGIRLNLLDNKLNFTATRYVGTQKNKPAGVGVGNGFPIAFPQYINYVIDTNPKGVAGSVGQNIRNVPEVPLSYSDVADGKTEGYEFEMVANPLRGWRLMANLARPKATISNAYNDTKNYLKDHDAVFRQILADAGILIDANNVATVDTSIPTDQRSPQANQAAQGWNGLQSGIKNFVNGDQPVTRLANTTANFFTDYTLQGGTLKGLRFGGGLNYRGREIIGFHGGDTIVDPTNPTNAIRDPNASATRPVYSDPIYTATLALGYTIKLSPKRSLTIDFNISNLFNYDKPVYYNTVMRAPNGDVTTPARVTTPSWFYYVDPRTYSLSATLRF